MLTIHFTNPEMPALKDVNFNAFDLINALWQVPEYKKSWFSRNRNTTQLKPIQFDELFKSIKKHKRPDGTFNILFKKSHGVNLSLTLEGVEKSDIISNRSFSVITINIGDYLEHRLINNPSDEEKKSFILNIVAKCSIHKNTDPKKTKADAPSHPTITRVTSLSPRNKPTEENLTRLSPLPSYHHPLRPANEENPVYPTTQPKHHASIWAKLSPYLSHPLIHAIGAGVTMACALTYIGSATSIIWGGSILLGFTTFSVESITKWRQDYMQSYYIKYQPKSDEELLTEKLNTLLALQSGIKAKTWPNYAKSFFYGNLWSHFKEFGAGLQSAYNQDNGFKKRIERIIDKKRSPFTP